MRSQKPRRFVLQGVQRFKLAESDLEASRAEELLTFGGFWFPAHRSTSSLFPHSYNRRLLRPAYSVDRPYPGAQLMLLVLGLPSRVSP
jgi:hypothetical protein